MKWYWLMELLKSDQSLLVSIVTLLLSTLYRLAVLCNQYVIAAVHLLCAHYCVLLIKNFDTFYSQLSSSTIVIQDNPITMIFLILFLLFVTFLCDRWSV